MRNWISQLLGGGAAELPAGVPAEWAKALERQLERVDQIKGLRAGFARDALRFVLHGEHIAVLQEAAKNEEVCAAFGLAGYDNDEKKTAAMVVGLYGPFEAVPAPVMLRWAQLLAASLTQQHWGAM